MRTDVGNRRRTALHSRRQRRARVQRPSGLRYCQRTEPLRGPLRFLLLHVDRLSAAAMAAAYGRRRHLAVNKSPLTCAEPGTGSAGSLPILTTRFCPSTWTTCGAIALASASVTTA